MNKEESKEIMDTIDEMIDHFDIIMSYIQHAKFNQDGKRSLMIQMAIIGLQQILEQHEFLERNKEVRDLR